MKSLQAALSIINQRRKDAVNLAQNNIALANSNKEYAQLQVQLNNINLQLAQASINKISTAELIIKRLSVNEQMNRLLYSMNLNSEMLIPKYSCIKCSDLGYINGKKCKCLKKLITEIILNVVKIDPECNFSNATNVTELNEKIYNKCKNITMQSSFNILLCGKVGTGKSYLAQCITNQLIYEGKDIIFTSAFNFNSDMLNVHKSSSEEILPKYLDCDLLVIDDLGTEPVYKNVTLEYLFNVISERQRNNLSTLITTNLTLIQIKERYSDRIFSRLTDRRHCLVFELTGKDRRHDV